MRDLTWMAKYCGDFAKLCEPFQLHHWHAASNGRVVCAIDAPERGCFIPPKSDKFKQAFWGSIKLALACPAQQRTTLGDLWAWLDHCELRRCPDCNGTGSVWLDLTDGTPLPPHTPSARQFRCDCDGKLIYPQDDCSGSELVRVCGITHSAPFLAAWLDPRLGDCGEQIELGATVFNNLAVGVIRGNGWLVLSVGITGHDEPRRAYTPGAGEWYTIRHQAAPEVHPGTDWFIEQGYAEDDLVSMWGTQTEAVASQ